MSTRKQREILRERRMAFDRAVEENRPVMEAWLEDQKEPDKPKKRGRPKKKVE